MILVDNGSPEPLDGPGARFLRRTVAHNPDRSRAAHAGSRREPRHRDGRERLRRCAHRRRASRESRAARAACTARRSLAPTADHRNIGLASRIGAPHGCAATPDTTRPPRISSSPRRAGSTTATGCSPSARSRRRRRAGGSLRWGRATRCSWRSRCGRSSVASTSASRCRAADCPTTISTAGRASSTDVQLVVLLGEGTFHQIHGGAATSGRVGWDEMHDEYVKLRGARTSRRRTIGSIVGSVPDAALPHVEQSAKRGARAAPASPVGVTGQRSRLRKPPGLNVSAYFSSVGVDAPSCCCRRGCA